MSTVTVGVLLTGSANAYAANFGVLRAAVGAQGSVDHQVLHYPLVRSDINPTLRGVSVSSAMVAGGYLAFEEVSTPKTFYYVGSLPVLDAELPAVEQALSAGNLSITVITNSSTHASVNVHLIHIEGTTTDTALASTLPTVLALIGNPQLNVTETPISESQLDFNGQTVPIKDMKLFNKGEFTLINGNTLVFSLPRADAAQTKLGPVTASEPLGVGQTVAISGFQTGGMTVELALRSDEVQPVTAALMAGGFTISSQSDYYVDDSDRLTFVRAEAVVKNANVDKNINKLEQQGEALFNALSLIKKHTS